MPDIYTRFHDDRAPLTLVQTLDGPDPVWWTFLHFTHRPRSTMPRTRPPYPHEFRNRIVELARKGRTPSGLAEEFEPTEQTIRNWIKKADRDDGKSAEGLSTDEREELRELRKKLRQVKQERDILARRRNSCGAAWFARETGDVPPKSSDSSGDVTSP